jgi:transposase
MERDRLVGFLADGLSLDQIGAIVGRHPSTVAYWLKKYGLVANGHEKHSPKGGLPRDELGALVDAGETLEAIAIAFDVSAHTVRYWIARYGLPRPHSRRRAELERAISEGERTLLRDCRVHGWTLFVIENSGRARCRRCRIERVSAWRRRAKATLVEEAGGACILCGYDRCLAALQFHHVDPSTKSFSLSLHGAIRSMKQLRAEAAKCVLLCANCHAEVEAGVSELPPEILEEKGAVDTDS